MANFLFLRPPCSLFRLGPVLWGFSQAWMIFCRFLGVWGFSFGPCGYRLPWAETF